MARDRTKVVFQGNEMYYVSFGRGDIPLVMLPGLSDGLTTVQGKKLLLSAYYRMYAKDFRVYVFSRREDLPTDYSTEDMAHDQIRALDALGIDEFHLMGISQGGMIAQHIASNYPDRVSRLVLGVTISRPNPTLTSAVSAWIELAKSGDYKALTIDTLERTYSVAKVRQYRPVYPIITAMNKPKIGYGRFITQANACLNHNAHDSLKNITCPTLVLGGDSDRVVGVGTSEAIAHEIPDSRLIIYEGLGHSAYEEAGDFDRQALAFLLDLQP